MASRYLTVWFSTATSKQVANCSSPNLCHPAAFGSHEPENRSEKLSSEIPFVPGKTTRVRLPEDLNLCGDRVSEEHPAGDTDFADQSLRMRLFTVLILLGIVRLLGLALNC